MTDLIPYKEKKGIYEHLHKVKLQSVGGFYPSLIVSPNQSAPERGVQALASGGRI